MILKLTHLDLAHSSLWGLYGVSLYGTASMGLYGVCMGSLCPGVVIGWL